MLIRAGPDPGLPPIRRKPQPPGLFYFTGAGRNTNGFASSNFADAFPA